MCGCGFAVAVLGIVDAHFVAIPTAVVNWYTLGGCVLFIVALLNLYRCIYTLQLVGLYSFFRTLINFFN